MREVVGRLGTRTKKAVILSEKVFEGVKGKNRSARPPSVSMSRGAASPLKAPCSGRAWLISAIAGWAGFNEPTPRNQSAPGPDFTFDVVAVATSSRS
jgi:hypothetical protein